MTTIWKYALKVTDEQSISVPQGSSYLSVQIQHNNVCVWIQVPDTKNTPVLKTIWIVGTGNPMEVPVTAAFIGTFQLLKGDLVFHVFTDLPRY